MTAGIARNSYDLLGFCCNGRNVRISLELLGIAWACRGLPGTTRNYWKTGNVEELRGLPGLPGLLELLGLLGWVAGVGRVFCIGFVHTRNRLESATQGRVSQVGLLIILVDAGVVGVAVIVVGGLVMYVRDIMVVVRVVIVVLVVVVVGDGSGCRPNFSC